MFIRAGEEIYLQHSSKRATASEQRNEVPIKLKNNVEFGHVLQGII